MTVELQLLPATQARGEWSAQHHPLCSTYVALSAPDGCQVVGAVSAVDCPATQTRGTMSALAARALAAVNSGHSSMRSGLLPTGRSESQLRTHRLHQRQLHQRQLHQRLLPYLLAPLLPPALLPPA